MLHSQGQWGGQWNVSCSLFWVLAALTCPSCPLMISFWQLKISDAAAPVQGSEKGAKNLCSCSQILRVATILVSLQDPEVLRSIQERKVTHWVSAAQGWLCGQADSLECETLQTTHQERVPGDRLLSQPSTCSLSWGLITPPSLVLPRAQASP